MNEKTKNNQSLKSPCVSTAPDIITSYLHYLRAYLLRPIKYLSMLGTT